MSAKASKRHVDILSLDVVAQSVRQSSLDKFRILGKAKRAKGGVAFAALLGSLVFLEDSVVLGLATVGQHNSKHTGSEVRLDGLAVTADELLK